MDEELVPAGHDTPMAQPGSVHTEGKNKDLWDHRGEHPTQGEDQERLPGGGGLELG